MWTGQKRTSTNKTDKGDRKISLQQFHDIASGKYNAGDIKLTSENSITKANNHVSLYMKWRYNGESIKADEVVIANAIRSDIQTVRRGGARLW